MVLRRESLTAPIMQVAGDRSTIALLITELAYGGTPRTVQRLALGLARKGHRVRVASLCSAADIATELEAAGIPVVGFGIERRGVIAATRALLGFLRTTRPAILHTFNFHANLLGRVVGAALRLPGIVVSERSVESAKPRWRVRSDRLTWRLAHRWTVNAAAVAEVLRRRERVDAARIDVIPTGIDLARFEPRPRDRAFRAAHGAGDADQVLVCVGRLDRYKGHDNLLEAFAALMGEHPRARLLLVGDGRFRETLTARARSAGLAERVRFSGALRDVRPALAAADMFVQASDEEGLPGAVLEAMAMGLPVVATDVGGTREAVDDGVTGLLVAPRNAAALAAALARLLADPGLAARFGSFGRKRVDEEFSSERELGLTEEVYRRLGPWR
jgi:glycosyltransferase involved in cell wall biosynthesis